MIQKFIDQFMAAEQEIKESLRTAAPVGYTDLLGRALSYVEELDHESVHKIDDGDYQGMIVFIIPEKCYQPSDYYTTNVYYGSCSGCDTFQAIQEEGEWDADGCNDKQVSEYWTLMLHMMQKLTNLGVSRTDDMLVAADFLEESGFSLDVCKLLRGG